MSERPRGRPHADTCWPPQWGAASSLTVAILTALYGAPSRADSSSEDTAVLHKPFQRHELLTALARLVGCKAATARGAQAGG